MARWGAGRGPACVPSGPGARGVWGSVPPRGLLASGASVSCPRSHPAGPRSLPVEGAPCSARRALPPGDTSVQGRLGHCAGPGGERLLPEGRGATQPPIRPSGLQRKGRVEAAAAGGAGGASSRFHLIFFVKTKVPSPPRAGPRVGIRTIGNHGHLWGADRGKRPVQEPGAAPASPCCAQDPLSAPAHVAGGGEAAHSSWPGQRPSSPPRLYNIFHVALGLSSQNCNTVRL